MQRMVAQHAIDAEAHAHTAARGLDVNVGGALLERIFEGALHQTHDGRIAIAVRRFRAHRLDQRSFIAFAVGFADGTLQTARRGQGRRDLHAEHEAQLVQQDALAGVVDGHDQLARLLQHRQQALLNGHFLRHAGKDLRRDAPLVQVHIGQAFERGHDARDRRLIGITQTHHRFLQTQVAGALQSAGLAVLIGCQQSALDEGLTEALGQDRSGVRAEWTGSAWRERRRRRALYPAQGRLDTREPGR